MTPDLPANLTVRDVARHLNLRGETVRAMCGDGRLPGAFKLHDGPRAEWRIPRTALPDYREPVDPGPDLSAMSEYDRIMYRIDELTRANREGRTITI